MSEDNSALKKLEERKKKLDAEIRKAKASQAKKDADIYAEKCRIVGAAILAECVDNETLNATITPIVEKRTTSAKDRKTYGLEALPKKEKTSAKTSTNETTNLTEKLSQTSQ